MNLSTTKQQNVSTKCMSYHPYIFLAFSSLALCVVPPSVCIYHQRSSIRHRPDVAIAVFRPGGVVHQGIEKFRGPVKFSKGRWVGVQCDKPVGRNNGTVKKVGICHSCVGRVTYIEDYSKVVLIISRSLFAETRLHVFLI